ncbi:serine/threonine-protein kinase [Actinomadura alba]|uniref:non-specific serine/threonine protein kinase n=1 Tax=Actinomadura alba TaxID=406431 RepID=A0ABR7LJC8_9ACTN|nr:serine/threonine-protein kinase [Actinomadura alba]MBC6464960.1 protein kinase [Actinomadura alba]
MSQGAQEAGRLLARRYRLMSVVGQGGMGTVWRATDEVLAREVAVKEVVVRRDLADEERDLLHHRTLREARATARLNHPGIVTVHDVVDEDARPWIVMEFVESRSLQDVIEHEGPRPPRWVADMGRQTLGALRAAHATGILHRDVKPGNVLITGDDRAILTDFGIAQVEGDPQLTHTGLLVGSPAYIAPERVRGERATGASDLWALGATLYAACEGRPPYPQTSAMAVMAAILTQDPPPPHNAGPLMPLLRGLLHRDPAQRMDPGTAMDLLSQVADGTTPHPQNPHPQNPFPHSPFPHTPQSTGAPTMGEPRPTISGAVAGPGDLTAQIGPDAVPWSTADGDLNTVGVRRRRDLNGGLLAMVGGLVAVVIVLVGVLLVQDRSHRASGADGASSTASSTATATKTAGSAAPASVSPAPTSATSTARALPAGWRREQVSGATVAVPAGWRRSSEGASVFWRDPGSAAYLQVDRTPWTGRPYEAWKQWEREVLANRALDGYRRVGLRHVTGTPYEAADIEFTWNGRAGIPMHGVDRRVIAADGGRYAVFVALPAADWNTSQERVNGFLETFTP